MLTCSFLKTVTLCDQYNSLNSSKVHHSLLLIARFIFNFYCIVPFNQGNGRLALMLMQLLLIQNGHTFVKYVCLDKYIKKNESEYYNSIYKSSVNWYCEEHNSSFWLKTFYRKIRRKKSHFNIFSLFSDSKRFIFVLPS